MTRQSRPSTHTPRHQKKLRHLMKLERQKKKKKLQQQELASLSHREYTITRPSVLQDTPSKLKSILKIPRHSPSICGSRSVLSSLLNYDSVENKSKSCKKVVFGGVEMTTIPHRLDCEEYDYHIDALNMDRISNLEDSLFRYDILEEYDSGDELESRVEIDTENLNIDSKVEQEFEELLASGDEMENSETIKKLDYILEINGKKIDDSITTAKDELNNDSKVSSSLNNNITINYDEIILKDSQDKTKDTSEQDHTPKTTHTAIHDTVAINNNSNLHTYDVNNIDNNINKKISTRKRRVDKEQETQFLIDQTAYEARLARLRLLGSHGSLTPKKICNESMTIHHESPLAFYESKNVDIVSEKSNDGGKKSQENELEMELKSKEKYQEKESKCTDNIISEINTLNTTQLVRQDIYIMIREGIQRKKNKTPYLSTMNEEYEWEDSYWK